MKMNLKDNFKQATKDLWNGSKALAKKQEEQPEDKFISTIISEPTSVMLKLQEKQKYVQRTVIAAGDVMTGDIHCEGNMEIFGDVTGNITSSGDLRLAGKLIGNADVHNIEIYGGHMTGNITASGCVQVNADSVVIGDIQAKDLVLDGKLKGDLNLEGTLTMGGTAVVIGKINVDRLSVADGAAVQGEVLIRSVEFDKVFSNQVEEIRTQSKEERNLGIDCTEVQL